MTPGARQRRIGSIAASISLAASLCACGSTPTSTSTSTTSTKPPVTSTTAPLGSGAHLLDVDGTLREFRLHVPTSAGPGSALVLVFHGFTDSAANIEAYSHMNEVADEHGFVVAFPQGSRDAAGNTFFDVGYAFHTERLDDIGFARALQAHLVDRLALDARRVFVTGMSNGGDMAYHLACSGEPWVAAIAPVAGMILQHIADACVPAQRLSIMEIHGTADTVTLWEGDPQNEGGWGAYLSQMEAMQRWADGYALDAPTQEPLPALAGASPTGEVTMLRWTTAVDGTEVRLVRIEGGAHEWPGIEASRVVWDFFAGLDQT